MLEKLVSGFVERFDEAEKNAEAAAVALFAWLGFAGLTESASRRFRGDTRAQTTGANRATNLVVGLVVGGLMAAFLLPIAIEEIVDVETTDWSDGAASLWEVLPIMIVLAIFLFFVGLALARSNM